MEPNLFIKYRGPDTNNDSEINLVALGGSIIGFDAVIRDIFRLSKIKGDIDICASKTEEGSLIVDIIVAIVNNSDSIPFDRVPDLLDFLKVVNTELWNQASEYFNKIENVHKSINDFAREKPFDFMVIASLLGIFIKKIIGKAGNHKARPDLDDLPRRYAEPVHKMIKKRRFSKALKPFVDNEVNTIEISNEVNFTVKAIVDVNNFDSYLGEGEEVLPQFVNGEEHNIVGKVVGMQCSRGDSMKIRMKIGNRKYITLIALPPEGKTTKDYDEFYGQDVIIKATIHRDSLYQKPTLFILEMGVQQQRLDM